MQVWTAPYGLWGTILATSSTPRGPGSHTDLCLCLRMAVYPLWASLCLWLLQDIGHTGVEAILLPYDLILPNHTCRDPTYK